MGGKETKPKLSANIPVNDLVYRYSGNDNSEYQYSDDYTRSYFENRDRNMDELLNALSRLGVLEQLQPQGLTPRIPYSPIEPVFQF